MSAGPRAHDVQEGGLGRRPQRPINEIAGLGKDRSRDHQNTRRALEPVRASHVMLVPAVGEGVKDIRVNADERAGIPEPPSPEIN
jgi:hypothetical protein